MFTVTEANYAYTVIENAVLVSECKKLYEKRIWYYAVLWVT